MRKLWPSMPDIFFAVLLVSTFAQPAGLRALLADGDTGWHIRTGELVLASGHAPQVDQFSFTRPGEPWFAWEWLSDVIFARMYQWRGMSAVAALAGAVLALAAAILFARLMRRGCGLWIALAATLAAASASSVHYLARPHVFSILFYTLALAIVDDDRAGAHSLRVWLLVPLTAVWANLHAGFVAWLATLGVLVVVTAVGREWRRAARYAGLAAACALASLANPYGWKLHEHVARYLNSSWIMDHVQEFQSPNIRAEGMVVFALMLLAAVALAPRADRFEAALVLIWGFAALRSARHIPLFAIVAAPVVASQAAAAWQRSAAKVKAGHALRVYWNLGRDLASRPRVTAWLPASAVTMLLLAPAAGFPDSRFPVDAVERNIDRLAPAGAMPRILTSDQWADYVTFRLYPRQRIFFDGRSDFFGPELGTDYRALMTADRKWRELLDRYHFELALLPHDWALSTMLDREPGWRKVYEDRVGVLFERTPPITSRDREGAVGEQVANAPGQPLPHGRGSFVRLLECAEGWRRDDSRRGTHECVRYKAVL
jgi:hypothetical protein